MNKQLQAFARQELKNGLSKLNNPQQDLFKLMYGRDNGLRSITDAKAMDINEVVDLMPEDKLDWAMQQVYNTLNKEGILDPFIEDSEEALLNLGFEKKRSPGIGSFYPTYFIFLSDIDEDRNNIRLELIHSGGLDSKCWHINAIRNMNRLYIDSDELTLRHGLVYLSHVTKLLDWFNYKVYKEE